MGIARSGMFAGLLWVAGSVAAGAAPLAFHNTGEGLTEGQLDPNWTVVLPGGAPFGPAVSANDPNGAWIAPTPPNTWISVAARDIVPTGTYQYSTTFTIGPGLDPTTATLSGFWWADEPNVANGIYLNGVQVSTFVGAFWFDPNPANAAFTINSGFVSGSNVLTFRVTNTGGPGGTLIQGLRGSAEDVPEPALLALLGVGAAGLIARRKARS